MAIEHELNTDQSGAGAESAFAIVSAVLNKRIPDGVAGVISSEAVFGVLATLKDMAEKDSVRIADSALKAAKKISRPWNPGFSLLVAAVLNANGVRRQAALNSEQLIGRADTIRHVVHSHHDPRLTIVGLPGKVCNPIKSDGYLPDLGDAAVTVRLWKMAKSCERVRDVVANLCDPLLNDILPGMTHEERGAGLRAIFRESPGEKDLARPATFIAMLAEDPELPVQQRSRLRSRFEAMREYISGVEILDEKRFYRVLKTCASADVALSTLVEYCDMSKDAVAIRVLRDARRYPCYHDRPIHEVEHYAEALNEIVDRLDMRENLKIHSLDSTLTTLNEAEQEHYRRLNKAIYTRCMAGFEREIQAMLPHLYHADGRDTFLKALAGNATLQPISSMFEPILFSIDHSSLRREASRDPLLFARWLVTVYTPSIEGGEEERRREMISRTLYGAAQYVSAYHSNTKSKNDEGLDDVEFVMRGPVTRLSIHRKPPELGQFSIRTGENPHRTPWQSSAFLRHDRDGKLKVDSIPALELKARGAVPLYVEAGGESETTWLGRLASNKQPVFRVNKGDCVEDGLAFRWQGGRQNEASAQIC